MTALLDRTSMNFGDTLHFLKLGRKMTRGVWSNEGKWLELQRPNGLSKMTTPYIFITHPHDSENFPGVRTPWHPTQGDMMAEDWRCIL
jgi:hypothetical protein